MSMRVLIVGGAGVFGRRLVEGLRATSDAYLILAGRSPRRAAAAAADLGAPEAAALDRDTATPDDVRAIGADLVIDAAGPFQGADLNFARAVIEAGAHYLDLADARDFVAAFPQLDALARARGVAAITGASSTPALTHAVLDQLCAGWRRIDVVRAGIAPANRMQRGPAVMRAILSWVGAPVRVFAEGGWRERPGWSHCCTIDVPGLGRRRFALAETPDLDLIPARFSPRDGAVFMAGLELPLMQRGMETLAALRRWGVVRRPTRWARALLFAGELLSLFGSDRGGMIVEAFGRDGEDRPTLARWCMFAPNGRGPYTPTFAALALARRFARGDLAPPGARACVSLVHLDEFQTEFDRHGFTTKIERILLRSPIEAALGPAFAHLPHAVKEGHRAGPVTRLEGVARVEGPASPLAALAARCVGFPGAAEKARARVVMRLDAAGETWIREIGGARFQSRLSCLGPGCVRERFGPFSFDLALSVRDGELRMQVAGWRCGPLPLPLWLAPRSSAREHVDAEGRFAFDVPVALPLAGRLTHYAGALEMQAAPAAPKEDAA